MVRDQTERMLTASLEENFHPPQLLYLWYLPAEGEERHDRALMEQHRLLNCTTNTY